MTRKRVQGDDARAAPKKRRADSGLASTPTPPPSEPSETHGAGAAATKASTSTSSRPAPTQTPETRKDSAEVTDEPTRDSNQAAIEALDEHIFANIDGYKVAAAVKRELREQKRYEETTALTYGEVRCSAFADLLRECALTEKGTFADIGSGTGKAVLTAALCGFHDCLGIEIVDKLHACAEQGLDRAIKAGLLAQDAQVNFVHGDSFALVDRWTQKDLIFAPTTCFTEDLMAQLTAALSALKPGARIITTTRTLTSKLLKLVLRKRFKYARGSLVFMVYERVAK